ncbi:hypothetical protein ACFXG4_17925 [Nocardia sp. NPDC059246]|uniref:hypothetical protein n=1 Tax=unclassified Nocardia TaxID=2637762 RepID=UPI0036886D2A
MSIVACATKNVQQAIAAGRSFVQELDAMRSRIVNHLDGAGPPSMSVLCMATSSSSHMATRPTDTYPLDPSGDGRARAGINPSSVLQCARQTTLTPVSPEILGQSKLVGDKPE